MLFSARSRFVIVRRRVSRGREGWLLPRTHARNTLFSLPPQSVALHFSVVVSGLQVQRDGDEGGGGVSVEGGFGGGLLGSRRG